MKYIAFLTDETYGELDANEFHRFGEEVAVAIRNETTSPHTQCGK